MQIIITKVLEIKIHVFEHHSKRLDGNAFQSHNVWVMHIVESLLHRRAFLDRARAAFFNDNGMTLGIS